MDAGGVVESAAARSLLAGQQGLTVRIIKDQLHDEKELVAQVITGPQQVASQVYDGHGQIVPTPAGSSVDTEM